MSAVHDETVAALQGGPVPTDQLAQPSTPQRLQRRRTAGWRMPTGALYVGRPTRWGNPFRVGDPNPWGEHQPMDRAQAVAVFRYMVDTAYGRDVIRAELAGWDLACWCPLNQPCHADVLLEIANPPAAGTEVPQ